MPNPDIARWAAVGGRALRGRPQSAEHARKRAESTARTLATQIRACVRCGEGFTPRNAAQKYCTAHCYDTVQRAKRTESSKSVAWKSRAKQLYMQLVATQGEACAVCGCGPNGRRLAVDHDHATGAIRGLLCDHCNRAIGSMHDDADRLVKAAAYLRRSRLRSVV